MKIMINEVELLDIKLFVTVKEIIGLAQKMHESFVNGQPFDDIVYELKSGMKFIISMQNARKAKTSLQRSGDSVKLFITAFEMATIASRLQYLEETTDRAHPIAMSYENCQNDRDGVIVLFILQRATNKGVYAS